MADEKLSDEMDNSIKEALAPRELDIYYDPESDTLSLWNGSPAGFGEMVAEHLTAESNSDGEIVGITLEHAAELLRPHIFPGQAHGKVKKSSA